VPVHFFEELYTLPPETAPDSPQRQGRGTQANSGTYGFEKALYAAVVDERAADEGKRRRAARFISDSRIEWVKPPDSLC
jgi:hypothetical protein